MRWGGFGRMARRIGGRAHAARARLGRPSRGQRRRPWGETGWTEEAVASNVPIRALVGGPGCAANVSSAP